MTGRARLPKKPSLLRSVSYWNAENRFYGMKRADLSDIALMRSVPSVEGTAKSEPCSYVRT